MGAALLLPRLRPDQWRIVEHPAKVKAVAMGRRWGKTIMAGATALSCAAHGGKVAWIVPHYKNGRPLWRWAEGAVAPLKRRRLVETNRTERTIDFAGGGFLAIYSADNDSSIRGEWFNLAILEEAAQIAEETWTDVVQPTLADADGDAILISTPKGKNWFWSEWQRGYREMSAEIAAFRAPSSDNPMPSIQKAAQLAGDGRIPENTYRQEWLAEFVTAADDIFDRDWFAENRFDITEAVPAQNLLGRYLSWDTALKDKDTADYSACVVGELVGNAKTNSVTALRIVEVWRDKVTFPNLLDHMARMKRKHNADGKLVAQIIEDKVSGTSAYQTLVSVAPPSEHAQLVAFSPHGSKDERASQAAIWCKVGMVQLPVYGPLTRWLRPFEDELFQTGQYFDQRDAFAQLVIYLENLLSAGRRAGTAGATRGFA